ncbi:hypothetical protein JVT61DRAFT_903 [Boletus reticuloceps]|uniref:TFIIS-type domain-containing protein n=1 Tax=Boletus reticuloceps TaxID=495285 RepID=A0A8I2YT39_9AGAM|nr:hypothetical protein JVT61DRAFT_903 [Boletus reticuloceps]
MPSAAMCDKCNHRRAYFYQLQIRSADEPMTTCTSSRVRIVRGLYLTRDKSTGITDALAVDTNGSVRNGRRICRACRARPLTLLEPNPHLMSDQSPPPKPKPGSLRDRIAAFENKGGGAPPPGPPQPRPKPGGLQWKPSPPSPTTSSDHVQPGERKPPSTGGMSASDAMESIGRGGSLRERMAALQGKGAFGGPPPPIAPKPNVERPKWKPPPSVPSVCPEDEPKEGIAGVDATARETSRSPPPRSIASPGPASAEIHGSSNRDGDVGAQEDDDGDPDPERRRDNAEWRSQPVWPVWVVLDSAWPAIRKPEHAPSPAPEVKDEAHGDQPAIVMESNEGVITDDALSTIADNNTFIASATLPPHDIPAATSAAPDAVTETEHKDELSPLVPTRITASMPVPAGPRRAAPPRKKSSKNAPTTALPEPPAGEAEGVTVHSSSIINEPPASADHAIQEGDSQEIAEVAEADESQQCTTSPPAPREAFHEPVEEPKEQEAEEELLEGAGSHVEEESMHTATGEQEVPSERPPTVEEEEEEEARRQRVAAKLAQMGAFNPLAGPPRIPSRRSFDEPAIAPSEAPLDVEDEVNVDTEEHEVTIPPPLAVPPRHDAVHIIKHDATEPHVGIGEDDRVTPHRDGERAAASDAEEQGGSHDGRPLPAPEYSEDQPITHDSVLARQAQGTASTQEAAVVDISGTVPLRSDIQEHRLQGDSGDLVLVCNTTAKIERDTSEDEAEADEMPPPRITRHIPPPPVNLRSKPTPPSSPPLSPPAKTPLQALRLDEEECPPSPDIPPRPIPPPGRSGACSLMAEDPPSPRPRRSIPPPPRRTSSVRVTDTAYTPPIITTLAVQEQVTSEEHEKEHVTEEDTPENATPRPESPEDEESARRRAIAERMARLGGIRFGGPPQMNPLSRPPLPAAPPPTSIPSDEMEEEGPREGEDEDEAARRQRIAAKLAGMGGMRIGMLPPPSGLPPASARRLVTRQEDSESEDTVLPVPIPAPLQRPQSIRKPPPPIEVTVQQEAEQARGESRGTSDDDGAKVEVEESPVEEVRYSDADRSTQRAHPAEALPTPPPRMTSRLPPPGRPPIPAIPTVLLGRRSSTTVRSVSSSRQTSLDESSPGETSTTPGRASSESIPRPQSEYVIVEAEAQDGDEPPALPPPRHKSTRGGSIRLVPALPPVPPPSAIDPPEALTSSAQWELPPIPQGFEFGEASEMASLGWSEGSTAVHVLAPPSSSSHTGSRNASVNVGQPSSSTSVSMSGSGSGSGRRSLDQQPQLTTDELMAIWGKTGVRVIDAATTLFDKSKRALVGDGSHAGFVRAVLAQVPGAVYPSGMTGAGAVTGTDDNDWGYVVYAQTGNAVQRRMSDIMPGDVIAIWDAKFKGHKGLHAYTQTVGITTPSASDSVRGGGPVVGIVSEFDGKKSKVRVWQANQHVGQQVSWTSSSLSVFWRLARMKNGVLTPRGTQTVEIVSYRLEDMKSGQVKVYRVLEA